MCHSITASLGSRLQGNLPAVAVHDMKIRGNELAVATHGRSFWILDDLTHVQAGPRRPRRFRASSSSSPQMSYAAPIK